jgi:hypothetical protein
MACRSEVGNRMSFEHSSVDSSAHRDEQFVDSGNVRVSLVPPGSSSTSVPLAFHTKTPTLKKPRAGHPRHTTPR